jgi:hypothetical protein
MALEYWLATMPVVLDGLREYARSSDPALREAIDAGTVRALAIEVLRDDADPKHLAVLLSVADDQDQPTTLTCWLAFSNDPAWCDRFRGFGVPMLEAEITLKGQHLEVKAPIYPVRDGADPLTLRDCPVIEIKGVDIAPEDSGRSSDSWEPSYSQCHIAPDVARQANELLIAAAPWHPLRRFIRKVDSPTVQVKCLAGGYPDLVTLVAAQIAVHSLWSGRLVDVDHSVEAPAVEPVKSWSPREQRETSPTRQSRASVFGRPMFRFEEVEVVGFRLELPADAMPKLQQIVEPLNFLSGGKPIADDVRYRAATPTVVLELLRYGKMKSVDPIAPLQADDFMSQHELLVRLLVGKVDDDGAQARDAALFVPAIFVDNPWSKVVGRELQGFKKELAQFCVNDSGVFQALAMDGTLPNRHEPEPLLNVTRVRVLARVGDDNMNAGAETLLDLEYPPGLSQGDDRFEQVDLGSSLRSSLFVGSRWRQADFDEVEFRRSFARKVMGDGFYRFRSVQVTPVDERPLPKTWITGSLEMTDVQVQFPTGVASVTLRARGPAPQDPWWQLCELFGQSTVSLPTGGWYRVKCAIDLKIDNGLDW